MNKGTIQLLLLLGAAGLGIYLLTRGKAGGNGTANAAAQIAQANAAAQIAEANAAVQLAELQKDQWYAPLIKGLGEGGGKFLGGLSGLL